MKSLALFVHPDMPCPCAGQELLLKSRDRPMASAWTFGRSPDCDVVFDNERARTVSRLHCALQYSSLAGRWEILDLDSSCGTWLNGFRLPARDPAPLEIQDRFSLGTLPFEFVVLEGPNDTIDGEEQPAEADGPPTIASTEPITKQPQQPGQGETYSDSLYALVLWFTSGETLAGKIERFLVAVALVAVTVVVVAVIL